LLLNKKDRMMFRVVTIYPKSSVSSTADIIERLCRLIPENRIDMMQSEAEVLEAATKETIDAILLINEILTKDGMKICKNLKASEATRSIPIIMYTEEDGESFISSFEEDDFSPDIFIKKSYSDREIKSQLKLLMRLKEAAERSDQTEVISTATGGKQDNRHKSDPSMTSPLQLDEKKYLDLIHNLNDAIYIRYNRNFEFINKKFQEMFRVTLEELKRPEFDFIKLVAPKSRDFIEERERKLERGEYIEPKYEFTALPADGRKIEVEASISRISYKDGYAIQGIVRDITKRKLWEKRMRQARKIEALSTLASGIAHQFNNILAIIRGYTELSLDSQPEDSILSRNLKQVLEASDRARGLVNQILIFSQQAKEGQRPLEISSIIKTSLHLLQSSWPTNIELRQDIQLNAGYVLAEPSQIRQLIVNFCTNAFYAIGNQKGVIEISLKRIEIGEEGFKDLKNLDSGPYLKLTVKDTGHGMDNKTKERIFDPFFTTRATGGGTGMGLAVILGIIKTCGGDILVESEPGKGTGFHLFLPRLNIEHDYEEMYLNQPPPSDTSFNKRLLFVDDEKMVLDVHRQMLERLGYHVTAVSDVYEALEVFSHDPEIFDLVITDHAMPGMTGIGLAKKILDIRPDIPIILCTGLTKPTINQEAKDAGITDFIMKPIVMKDLATTIKKVFDKNKQEKKAKAGDQKE